MKKTVLMISAILVSAVTFAQDLTSKKGETILPEAGDWAIGFEATPFLNYAGNLFNSGNSAPTANFLDSNMFIYGKYFVDAQTAYRAKIRVGFGSRKNGAFVTDDEALAADPTSTDTKEDERKVSYSRIAIGFGLEKRKGNTRLQGFYGGEVMVSLGSDKTTYDYGNSFTTANLAPTTNDFGGNLGTTPDGRAGRATESKEGSTFGVGVRGFIGAEYFIFPKISIAAEYGWGVGMQSTGESEVTLETLNNAGTASEKVTTKTTTKSSEFGLDTDNTGGNLRIMFHF